MNRWMAAGAAVAVALVLVLSGVAAAQSIGGVVGLELGLPGVLLIALALWQWPSILPAGLLLVGMPWAFALAEGGRGGAAVGVGAGLLLAGELCGWSLDRRSVVPEPAADAVRTGLRTAGLVAAGALVSTLLVAVSALPAPGSLLRLLVGLAAAAAVTAFLTLRRWET
jgi:hypothetical protein